MKKQILIIIALCTGITVFGQESEELVKEKTKRFSIGIQAVLLNSSYGGNNLQEYGGGIYMRYFLGKRLAINMQANTTIGTHNGFGIADYKRRVFSPSSSNSQSNVSAHSKSSGIIFCLLLSINFEMFIFKLLLR